MASGLLLLLDDIATILDDVAVMSKMAAKKTAGVLGDDLALNAQQVSGVRADRELSVVWSVAKGSFVNNGAISASHTPVRGSFRVLQSCLRSLRCLPFSILRPLLSQNPDFTDATFCVAPVAFNDIYNFSCWFVMCRPDMFFP